jgi:beta-lactamase superfamily II metal-dependent hydrolase
VFNPFSGLGLRVDLIHLDIVNPNKEQSDDLLVENEGDKMSGFSIIKDTNLYSIVYLLSLKNFKGLFLGDIPKELSDTLALGDRLVNVDYIKVPHHGSINGMTENLLQKLVPKGGLHPVVGVISVGAKNMWGFPAPEIIEMLNKYGIKTLRTDEVGDAEVITDGARYWTLKKEQKN